MPADRDGTLLARLVDGRAPVGEAEWRRFWLRLRARLLHPGEALAVVSTLSARPPDPATIEALLRSLTDPSALGGPPLPGSVNIVGTGGGPPTLNLSTAAAFVAASLGARVVKTGSRAWTSRCGSVDLLEHLDVPLTRSADETAAVVDAFGIAFAGSWAYPKELRLLAKRILPFDLRTVGGFFNAFGPFLAAVPVSAQLTGVSNHALRPAFVALASARPATRFLIATNASGIDELVSLDDNLVYDSALRRDVEVSPRALGLGAGSPADLRPPARDAEVAEHFTALLAGRAPRAAVDTVALNAAAMAVACGAVGDWRDGVRAAAASMSAGEPLRLLERIRAAVLR